MRRAPEVGDEAGSLVIEAVAGIGMLAVLTASLATAVPALIDARDRAARHHEVLAAAVDVLERTSAGIPDGPREGAVGVGVDHAAAAPDGCDDAGAVRFDVRAHDVTRSGSREVVLPGRIAPGADHPTVTGESVAVRIHRSTLDAAQLVATSAAQAQPLAAGSNAPCASLQVVAPGRYEIGTTGSSSLIGPTHLRLDEHPLPITVGRRSVDRDLVAAPAALLTVDIATSGARPPDGVSTGGLVWTVRGDDARDVTPLGGTRPVHPGEVTVVVSACSRAEAAGSSMRVATDPGQVSSVAVPLATVRIDGIGTRTDRTLVASRFTECVDGSPTRPTVWWSGGLADGMRIALPRGLWQLSLTMPGLPESPRVLVPAGEPHLVVVMP